MLPEIYGVVDTKQKNPFSLQSMFPSPQATEDETAWPSRTFIIFEVWFWTIHTYSLGVLTVASDKLVALSGMAQEFSTLIGGRYLAGIWETEICRQLGWAIMDSVATRPSTYRAPSWSWASIDGKVNTSQLEFPFKPIKVDHPQSIGSQLLTCLLVLFFT